MLGNERAREEVVVESREIVCCQNENAVCYDPLLNLPPKFTFWQQFAIINVFNIHIC